MHLDLTAKITPAGRVTVLAVALGGTAAIALADRSLVPKVSLGVLYLLPLALLGTILSRSQVLVFAVIVAILREQFGPAAWNQDAPARLAMGLVGFCCAGVLIAETVRRRRIEANTLGALRKEEAMRHAAEEGARAIIEGSPAAIITVGPEGLIEMTNRAANRLLGIEMQSAAGQPIRDYFPLLGDLMKKRPDRPLVHTMVEGRGRNRKGEGFHAQMWVSLHGPPTGMKLTAVVADVSEQLRDREELGLRQLLTHSRIIVAAVSHEIRNLAAAAASLHATVGTSCGVAENEDFEALGKLILGLRKLSSADLPGSSEQTLAGVNLDGLLRDLNIILRPDLEDSQIELTWEIAEQLPPVRADQSGLLQVLLNLTQNSVRALQGQPRPHMTIAAYQLNNSVVMHVFDNGPGITAIEKLFYPFQSGSASTGLGLYVSRAIVRTYGGELQYIRRQGASGFLIQLQAVHTGPAAHA